MSAAQRRCARRTCFKRDINSIEEAPKRIAIYAHHRDLEARAIWKREQVGYGVTIHPGHGSIVTNPSEHVIATLTSLDELRALADQVYELVWLGYRRVETA